MSNRHDPIDVTAETSPTFTDEQKRAIHSIASWIESRSRQFPVGDVAAVVGNGLADMIRAGHWRPPRET